MTAAEIGLNRGDKERIAKRARKILKAQGYHGWDIHSNSVSYHMQYYKLPGTTIIARVVRELIKDQIEQNRQQHELIKKAVAAA